MTRQVVVLNPPGGTGRPPLSRAPDFEILTATSPGEVPDAADCVVCVPVEGWRDAVRRLRARSLPVVVTGEADHGVAAEASRLGAEYAPVEALADSDETLVDRVRAQFPTPGERAAGIPDGGVDATAGPSPDVTRSPWFDAVFDHPTSFVGLLDTDGRVLRVNQTALDSVAGDHADAEATPFWDVPWWTPDDDLRDRIRDRVERAAAGETVAFTDDYYAHGERRVARASFAPVRCDGEVVGVVAGGHDVTELKRSEGAMQDLNEVATSDAPFEEKVGRLLAVGADYLGVEVGFLTYLEREADGDYLRMVEVSGDADFGPDDRVPLEQAYCKATVEQEGTVAIHDAREAWADDPAFESGLSCYLGGKVEVDGELYGTACFADREPRDRAFSESERAFVEGLVAWIREEVERREDRREIAAARDRTQRILERIGDGFFAIDADWEFAYVNERAAAMLERDPEELVGENVWEEFPESMADAYYEEYHRAMDEQVGVEFEEYFEPLDLWTEVRAYPDEEGLSVFFSDITERKRDRQALEDLYTATTGDGDAETTIRDLLELGCEYLDLDVGFFASVDDDDFEVLFARGDHERIRDGATSPLSETYCRHAVESGQTFVVEDASEQMAGDPAYEKFDLGCYLGGNVYVDGELYGTLCFADDAAREASFTDRERTFVELLLELASYEWERHERETALEDLLSTTRLLMDADSPGVVADVVSHAVEDVIGYDYCVVRRHDPRTATLDPVLVSGRGDEPVPDRPGYEVGEGNVGRAFERGETVYDPDLGDGAVSVASDAVRSAVYLPLGDQGVLTVASTELDGFDEVSRRLLELLSVNVSAALQRVDREASLEALLSTTRELMAAETDDEVAATTAAAASDVLGFAGTGLRLHDPERDVLVSVSIDGDRSSEMADRPDFDVADSPHGRAFRTGETVVHDVEADDPYGIEAFERTMYVPLGDYGVLSVGTTEPDGFDEGDRKLLELLSVNATAALGRARRERTLRGYRTVLENVSEMAFAVDGNSRVTLVTDALARQWGVDAESAVGEPIGRFVDSEVIAEASARLRDGAGGSVTLETELEVASGRRFPAEIQLSPVEAGADEGAVGIIHDISELAETRTELSSERERFQYLFDELPDPVVEVGYDSGEPVVRAVNDAFEEVFGVDETNVVGERSLDVVEPPDGGDRGLGEGSATSSAFVTEVERETADGSRTFIFRAVPYYGGGETRMFVIYTDITDRKERTRRLELLHRVLRHNLRNDMTVVLGHAELLHETAESDAQRRAATTILNTAERVTDLSDVASEIQRTMTLAPGDAPTEPIDGVVASVVEDRRERHPDVEFEVEVGVSAPTLGGRDTRRAIDEVVENAAMYGDGEVSVTTGVEGEQVTVRVTDDGPGIPDRERRVIAGDGEITQMEHSRGLGLWLTRSIVRAYGGSLTFEDAETGTVVVIRLPRR